MVLQTMLYRPWPWKSEGFCLGGTQDIEITDLGDKELIRMAVRSVNSCPLWNKEEDKVRPLLQTVHVEMYLYQKEIPSSG
jgi:hypothetical protein